MTTLTSVQIAVLALAYESFERHPPAKSLRHPDDVIAVWGYWQAAAIKLLRESPPLLASLGTARGTREMEWRNLHGRHRRGGEGRPVHLYRLERRGAPLAARCAWAIENLPATRQVATWKDVPAELPEPRAGGRCPACGCGPSTPCVVALASDCGEGTCVPAGVVGFTRCSACAAREAA